jgi:enoyl-CoA hydratase/carnithine racemase
MSLVINQDGPVARVTLSRPEVRNAFNEELIAELTAWAGSVTTSGSARVAVLSGAGPVFCAGADLTWMSKMVAYTHEENIRDARAMAQMFEALDRLPIPLIGRIHGAALGGGAGLAAVCDIVVDRMVAKFVNDLLSSAPEAIAAAKALIAEVSTRSPTSAAEYTIDAIAARRVSPEGQDGMSAFLAKRPPSWISSGSS